MTLLSIIVPVYNEEGSIREIVRRITSVAFPIPYEIVIVDDGSTDGTRKILEHDIAQKHSVIFHEKNKGKGGAIQTALAHARGDAFIVQDADLEYHPRDIVSLVNAMRVGTYDVVYGSRALGRKQKEYASFFFHIGGLLVTWWTNVLYGTALTDEATGYKLFTRRALASLTLTCSGFAFCAELTGKLLRAGYTIHEVPISYAPRSRKEGKKIQLRDGVSTLWTLFRIRFFS